jgi:hypothetical protein
VNAWIELGRRHTECAAGIGLRPMRLAHERCRRCSIACHPAPAPSPSVSRVQANRRRSDRPTHCGECRARCRPASGHTRPHDMPSTSRSSVVQCHRLERLRQERRDNRRSGSVQNHSTTTSSLRRAQRDVAMDDECVVEIQKERNLLLARQLRRLYLHAHRHLTTCPFDSPAHSAAPAIAARSTSCSR